MKCKLTDQNGISGWCERHGKYHTGHNARFATGDDVESIRRRELWDNQPNFIQRGINYGKATYRFRKNHGYILPLDMAEPRLAICQSNKCGMYDAKLDRCLHRKCGCTVKEKVTWSTESCPEGHWLPVSGPVSGGKCR